jgi:hypothetical protein
MADNAADVHSTPSGQRTLSSMLGLASRPTPVMDDVILAPNSINPQRRGPEVVEFLIAGEAYIRCKNLTSRPRNN